MEEWLDATENYSCLRFHLRKLVYCLGEDFLEKVEDASSVRPEETDNWEYGHKIPFRKYMYADMKGKMFSLFWINTEDIIIPDK